MKSTFLHLALLAGVLAAPKPAPARRSEIKPYGPNIDTPMEARTDTVAVELPAASGTVTGFAAGGIESFNGIPFADPPVGQLRLKPPQKLSAPLGDFNATGIAPSCPQMFLSEDALGGLGSVINDILDIPFLQVISGQEDCLTVTVQRPAGTKAGDKLPVLFWIFGGGFEFGSTITYDAGSLLNASVAQDQPFVYVAVNYRVGGFGFMPGSEILKDGASNLGLLDQRMGLQWVADNIEQFGGDPDKVTLWGESAGSISIFDQLALYDGDASYNGKQLFRGVIMHSGSLAPADPVDCPKGQAVYDEVVREAGCDASEDTLSCLRSLDYDTFLKAANSVPGILSYTSVALSYLPRPDGTVLTDSPDVLLAQGKYHAVPFIVGDQEDEGTLFALFQPNITTTGDLVSYLSDIFFHDATTDEIQQLVDGYSVFLTEGSPFRTGFLNEFYPGFKRLAAILGDLTFTLTRRLFLNVASQLHPDVPSWSYLASYDHGTPILGTFHASDILQVFYGIEDNNAARSTRTYYFNFLYNVDPNQGVGGYDNWPQWKDDKQLMWFETGDSSTLLADDFRSDSYDFISTHTGSLYI